MSWFDDAACKGMDPSIFYLEVGQNGTEAREVCGRCPVVDACAVHALKNREQFGIWGGLAPRERGIHRPHIAEQLTHCPQGHLYDEMNTYKDKAGHRRCRQCRAQQLQDYRQRSKGAA